MAGFSDAMTVLTTGFFFKENPEAIAQLAADPELGKALNAVARDIKAETIALTPAHTGATRRSVKFYNARLRDMGEGEPQQAAVVASFDAIWHLIEFGSVNNPAYRPMTIAAKNVCGEMFVESSSDGEPGEIPGDGGEDDEA